MPRESFRSGRGWFTDKWRIYYTPEIHIWLNNKKTKKEHRPIFFKKVKGIIEDIKMNKRPMRGHVKIISTCEVPIYYMRLENAEGIRILYDYKYRIEVNGKVKFIELFLLAVSNKKNIQDMLERSAEHKVHASSLNRLEWCEDNNEELDLALISSEEFNEFKKKSMTSFSRQSHDQQQNGWSSEKFKKRIERATIYDFRIANQIDPTSLPDDYEIPGVLKLQTHQEKLLRENKKHFLLEGVAGTGKTTILMYRFIEDVKTMFEEGKNVCDFALFVTHNERLRDEVKRHLDLFFPKEQKIIVEKCIRSIAEVFTELIGGEEKCTQQFPPDKKLTRERFHSLFGKKKIDIDLFWEEYRGILRGYNLHGERRLVDKKEYLVEIGRRRGRINKEQRTEFYQLALEIEKVMNNRKELRPSDGGWDDLDKCKYILNSIQNENYEKKLDFIYVDEVQDLTSAELEILLRLLSSNGLQRIAMAGDLSQSIQPSSFTWQALSDLIRSVLKINVCSEDTLLENFRSTPYLVHAANYILSMQGEIEGKVVKNLQRPFSGENTGEPALVFLDEEDELIRCLQNNDLPNAPCPLLVRDEKTKDKLRELFSIENRPFIETIAKFKGLEMKSILLWDPTNGSENHLDLITNPSRGKQALKGEHARSTALLELRYLFVGFTRARYLMGICCPNPKDAYFIKKAITDEDSIIKSATDAFEYFDLDNISIEDYSEFAREYLNAEQYEMAAQSFRNAKDEHAYHYCKAKQHLIDGEISEAIYRLCDSAKLQGRFEKLARELIGEYSSQALNESESENKIRLTALILNHLPESIDKSKKNRMKGELAMVREEWQDAALLFLDAKHQIGFNDALKHIIDPMRKIQLLILAGDMKGATSRFKRHISLIQPSKAILIALNVRNTIDSTFKGEIIGLKKFFSEPDFIWAKKIAGKDRKLLQIISNEEFNIKVKRGSSSSWEEREIFNELLKRKAFETIDKREWLFIKADVEIESCLCQNDLSNALLLLHEKRDDELWFSKHSKNIVNKYDGKMHKIVSVMTDEKIEFDNPPSDDYAQKIVICSWVARCTYITNSKAINLFFPTLIKEMYNLDNRQTSAFAPALLLMLSNSIRKKDISTPIHMIVQATAQLNKTFLRNINMDLLLHVAVWPVLAKNYPLQKIHAANSTFKALKISNNFKEKVLFLSLVNVERTRYLEIMKNICPAIRVRKNVEAHFLHFLNKHPSKADQKLPEEFGIVGFELNDFKICNKNIAWIYYILMKDNYSFLFESLIEQELIDGNTETTITLPENIENSEEINDAGTENEEDEDIEIIEEIEIEGVEDFEVIDEIEIEELQLKSELDEADSEVVDEPYSSETLSQTDNFDLSLEDINALVEEDLIVIPLVSSTVDFHFPDEIIEEILEAPSNINGIESLKRISEFLTSSFSEDVSTNVKILRDAFDDIIDHRTAPIHFKFAVMLAIRGFGGLNYGEDKFHEPLDELSLTRGNLFRNDHMKEIVGTNLSYSQRAFNDL